MYPSYFILGFFFIVVGIPVLANLYKRHIKYKERQLEAINKEAVEQAARYAAHTERLEQRMRVLERIVTDKGIVVADEIERLRDERPIN
jgi:hypothetical protein